jgi:agmatinase
VDVKINRSWEPGYAGGATFMKVPLVLEPAELAGADVVIVGAPVDDFVTFRPGTRFGPRAIRTGYDAGGDPRMPHMDLGVDPFQSLTIVDHGDAEVVPGDGRAGHAAIRRMVDGVLDAGAIPIVLGGDHSISYPDISAVAARYPAGTLAVIQFDTHADTATENWGVKESHGTPFRRLVDEGSISGHRLVQIGLRGYWPGHDLFDWARANGVRWHRMEEIIDRGIDSVIDDVLEEVEGAEAVWLSVDIDVLDPAFAPGTGTPEPGGMSTRELLRSVRRLVIARGMAGMDVVEVSPPYDHAELTAMAANRVVLEALSALALHRKGGPPMPEEPL